MRFLLTAGAALLAPSTAAAADIQLLVRDQSGAAVRDAVVTIVAPGRAAPARPARPFQVEQKDIRFNPFVLVVPVGAEVVFPNRDKVRHHVYSFSKPKKFELKLYGREEQRSVRFDTPGAVAIGCNIHDSMSGFIKVVDTPWAAKTDEAGRAAIGGLPGGTLQLRVWHPRARAPGNELVQAITLPAAGRHAKTVALTLTGGRS